MISISGLSGFDHLRQDNAFKEEAAPVETLSEVRELLPEEAVNAVFQWLDRKGAVESAFVPVAERLSVMLGAMENERPDVMGRRFDLVHKNGRMKVVDSDLDAASTEWVESRVNEDKELGRSAGLFNRQVVETYGANHDREGDDGLTHRGSHRVGLHQIVEYNDLSTTVDGLVRFRSLLADVRRLDLPFGVDESSRFLLCGDLVQDYIVGDITTYGLDAEGNVTTERTRGSVRLFNIWG
ncbi:hypothetical protein [Luteibacter sp.]|jgi:hypothetical protein|uniref:hypothetical protein n=1 Tax=Luteibacter sp. TaxID=1886636 RepID=UPI002F3FB1E4